MSLRTAVKRRLEDAILWSGIGGAVRWQRRRQAVILAYHNIVESCTGRGDSSLHLQVSRFRAQLDLLASTHDVVPLEQVFRRRPAKAGRPAAVITFDDAYEGAMTLGVAELRKRGLPGAVFACSGLPDGVTTWWDGLARLDGRGLDPEVRRIALDMAQGDQSTVMALAEANRWKVNEMPKEGRIASRAVLLRASEYLTVGVHTVTHPNLTKLDPARVVGELVECATWVREQFGVNRPTLAYPYGLFNDRVVEAVKGAGYRAAFRVEGGFCRPGPNLEGGFDIPRVNIPSGLSDAGFELLVSGVGLR